MAYKRGPALDRFMEKVSVEPMSGCWLWTASAVPAGYGLFTPAGQGSRTYAHRWSWEHHNGAPIPDGMHVCHRCDTPACVRPDHLFIGSASDNMTDARRKGRLSFWNSSKTECPLGHPYDDANTGWRRNRTERSCRECSRQQMRRQRAALRKVG